MDKKNVGIGWFILVPALAMWLGWGLRGQMGHATGAMIPGAVVALALCSLLPGKRFSRGLVIGLTAVAFGFGAEMTTLQSAGMVMRFIHPPMGTIMTGYIGLAIKGALWALFGGAGLGLALAADHYRLKDLVLGLVFMLGSFYAGWALINRPKLLYFSVDRPEIWAGLLFGAIVLLAWLTVRGHTSMPLLFAACGAIAGGIGYPVAVTLATAGIHSAYTGRWFDWWKVAETTFGAFMGAGLGIGTYLFKDRLPESEEFAPPLVKPGFRAWGAILGLAIGAVFTALYYARMPWIILGSILLCVAFCSLKAAWHVGVTLTYCGTAVNVILYWHHQQRIGNAAFLWTLAALATLFVAWKVTAWWAETDAATAPNAFVFVMWAILILSYLKTFINHAVLSPPAGAVAAGGGRWPYMLSVWSGALVVEVFFTLAALVLTWMVYRTSRYREPAGKKAAVRASEALT